MYFADAITQLAKKFSISCLGPKVQSALLVTLGLLMIFNLSAIHPLRRTYHVLPMLGLGSGSTKRVKAFCDQSRTQCDETQ